MDADGGDRNSATNRVHANNVRNCLKIVAEWPHATPIVTILPARPAHTPPSGTLPYNDTFEQKSKFQFQADATHRDTVIHIKRSELFLYVTGKMESRGMVQAKRVRAVFCGETQVGKSSIIQRFSKNSSSEVAPTVAGAFHSAVVSYDERPVSLELWDTAGSERYHSVIPSFFRNASAVVIVYDITQRLTFERLTWWIEFTRVNSPSDALIFLVGNKNDLEDERTVTFDEGKEYSDDNHCAAHTETSAKTEDGIVTLFALLAASPGNGSIEVPCSAHAIELHKESHCC
jgi:small GTP-binding protein